MSKHEMRVLTDLMSQVRNHTEWDESLRELICARVWQHSQFTTVNEINLGNPNLALAERVEAFLTDRHDWLLGTTIAHRLGFLVTEGIQQYDPMRFPADLTDLVQRERLCRYLRSVGCRADETMGRGPGTDGVNHYNIYSQARTSIGQMASNFESQLYAGFDTPHGKFRTLEGYYHVLRVLDYFIAMGEGSKDVDPLMRDICILQDHIRTFPELDELYHLDGATSIRVGREVKRRVYGGTKYRPGAFSAHAERCFMIAVVRKLHVLQIDGRCLGNVLAEIVEQKIPLDHYYVMAGKIMRPKFSEWLPNLIQKIVEQIDPYADTFDPDEVIKLLE